MNQESLTQLLKNRAADLGFTLVGVCPAVAPPGAQRLDEWLARGYAGDMHYLADRRDAYAHPSNVLEGARSIVMLALPYRPGAQKHDTHEHAEPTPVSPGQGRVARYAWGEADYHDRIRDRLHTLADYLRDLAPDAVTRGVVDTAPLLEREFAQLAGLGWVGKNTLLLNRDAGSYFFLAALLTDQELDYDAPHAADHCGTCTACLDACPTAAFPQPYVLDASRCISYLTIEHKGAIPSDLREGIGDWLFGCDICQEVCPWNHHAEKKVPGTLFPLPREKKGTGVINPSEASRVVPDPGELVVPDPGEFSLPLPRRDGTNRAQSPAATERRAVELQLPVSTSEGLDPSPVPALLELAPLFDLTEADFRTRFRHTPLWRPHRRGLLRNAAIVLGNQRTPAAIPALAKGLGDVEPLVRAACAWALGRLNPAGQPALQRQLAIEEDDSVRQEIIAAMSASAHASPIAGQ